MYAHAFEAPIVEHWFDDKFAYTVVWLPPEVAAELPLKDNPRLRVTGEMAELPFESACSPVRGRWYLMVGKAVMKDAGVTLGDTIEVRFDIADQNAVDIPLVLRDALREEDALRDAWDALTPGKQRGFAYPIAKAKRPDTQAKRIGALKVALLGEA